MNSTAKVNAVPLSRIEIAPPASRIFVILLALYLLILYPILRANRYFNDDLKRALIGHTGWDSNGRPLTTLLMKLLQCYDSALVDISPLTQILAVALLAWIGVLIARRYAIRSPWMAALIAFPLGAQPFYLENLSYKFDSLSMSLALLLALLPILTFANTRRGWWLGVLSLFGSLNFYQPAINAALIFILLDVVIAQLDEAPVRLWLNRLGSRVLQIGLTMLLYQLIVGIHIHGWVGRETQKIHTLDQLPLLVKNATDFYRFIGNAFSQQWWAYYLPLLIVLVAFPLVASIRYALDQRGRHKGWSIALLLGGGVFIPVVALFCMAGPMLLLLTPEFEPRVMMGVGALLVAGLVTMRAALAKWHRSPRWTMAAGCMLAMGMCSLASAYGNALGEQKAYEDRIATGLADDLAELKASQHIQGFLLDGDIGFAPITAHIADAFPMIKVIISPYIASADQFHTTDFLMYYVDGVTNLSRKIDPESQHSHAAMLAHALATRPWRTTTGYSLTVVDNVAVVSLHSAPAQFRAAENLPGARRNHPSL